MKKVFLLPYYQKQVSNLKLKDFATHDFDVNAFTEGKPMLFFINAKKAIHYLMEKFKLKRSDEVYISTTSDSLFVSTCVSATIFNS